MLLSPTQHIREVQVATIKHYRPATVSRQATSEDLHPPAEANSLFGKAQGAQLQGSREVFPLPQLL